MNNKRDLHNELRILADFLEESGKWSPELVMLLRTTANDLALETLLRRVATGCPDATTEMCEAYSSQILRMVRRQLNPHARLLLEPEDVVHEVWMAALNDLEQYRHFASSSEFMVFLTTLTRRIIVSHVRRRLA